MSLSIDDLTLVRNSLSYNKIIFEKAEIKERLARQEALTALKEELSAYNAINTHLGLYVATANDELLLLIKHYGEAVRKNAIATVILNDAYLDMVARQKALDIASNRVSQLCIIQTTQHPEF